MILFTQNVECKIILKFYKTEISAIIVRFRFRFFNFIFTVSVSVSVLYFEFYGFGFGFQKTSVNRHFGFNFSHFFSAIMSCKIQIFKSFIHLFQIQISKSKKKVNVFNLYTYMYSCVFYLRVFALLFLPFASSSLTSLDIPTY